MSDSTQTNAPNRTGGRTADLCSLAVIIAAVLLVAAPGIARGGLGWSDAPQHTFDGIFVLEFFKQLPLDDARGWAEQFYLRYPSLGIVVYYPPGFAAVEAFVFALFGVSIVTARLTVLLFGIGAGLLMFALGKRWFGRPAALVAALLLITCPHGSLWLNDVMLEWPATFWLLAAAFAYQADRDSRRARWSVALGAAIALAFFTKQTAGFILPVVLLHALWCKDRRAYLLRPVFIASIGVAAALIGGYTVFSKPYTALPATILLPSFEPLFYVRHLPEIVGWPLLPFVALGLAWLVPWRRLDADSRRARGLLLLWLLAWAVFSSTIVAKEPRYFFFSLPPLMLGAAGLLCGIRCRAAACSPPDNVPGEPAASPAAQSASRRESPASTPSEPRPPVLDFARRDPAAPNGPREQPTDLSARSDGEQASCETPISAAVAPTHRVRDEGQAPRGTSISEAPVAAGAEPMPSCCDDSPVRSRSLSLVATVILIAVQAAIAWTASPPRLPDYSAAVAELVARPDADLVLVDAVRDGEFILDVYLNAAARDRIIPLRASKLLYARAARVRYNYEQFVNAPADVVAMLDKYGIRYVVVESALPKTHYQEADPPPRKMLRSLLAEDPRFQLVRSWPLRCEDPSWNDVELRLYAYPDCPPRQSNTITLSFPGMGGTATFKLP